MDAAGAVGEQCGCSGTFMQSNRCKHALHTLFTLAIPIATTITTTTTTIITALCVGACFASAPLRVQRRRRGDDRCRCLRLNNGASQLSNTLIIIIIPPCVPFACG